MTKERVSTNIERKLRLDLDAKANKLGISRAHLIETAIKSELDRFNVHKENKRLTQAKAWLEEQFSERKAELTANHLDRIKEIAVALGVPDTIEHIKQRIAELHKNRDQFEREKTELTEQRDEFENQLHAETDANNKCYERAELLKKERDTFKARWETSQEELSVASEKLRHLLMRNWWERLWDILPWIDE